MTAPHPERRLDYLPLDDVVPAARNPKAHDEVALQDSLDAFGYVEPIVLDERTGRLVAGHGRVEALRQLRARGEDPPEGVDSQWRVPVLRGWASRDDKHAERYVIASNRVGEVGGWDEPLLRDLLNDLDTFYGTGYDADDLIDLAARLEADAEPGEGTDPYAAWEGMPEFVQPNKQGAAQVIVHFATMEDADDFFRTIDRPRQAIMWWPQHDGHVPNVVDEEYVADA